MKMNYPVLVFGEREASLPESRRIRFQRCQPMLRLCHCLAGRERRWLALGTRERVTYFLESVGVRVPEKMEKVNISGIHAVYRPVVMSVCEAVIDGKWHSLELERSLLRHKEVAEWEGTLEDLVLRRSPISSRECLMDACFDIAGTS